MRLAMGIAAGLVSLVIARSAPADGASQILFGDLHVHTTFSADAFERSLPYLGGDGAHPPADACDIARYCAGLDFWALTDHAESLTPSHWQESIAAVRRCNALATTGSASVLVSFLGWEWTQQNDDRDRHFGHQNVLLADDDPATVPQRPIAARAAPPDTWSAWLRRRGRALATAVRWPESRTLLFDWVAREDERRGTPPCSDETAGGECTPIAETPRELFAALDRLGVRSLTIPHGTTWGRTTPVAWTWDPHLGPGEHDDARQPLVEIFSGHGNMEEYRPWRAVEIDEHGELSCPETRVDFEPCCQRAAALVRSRCEDPESATCRDRVRAAVDHHVHGGRESRLTLLGVAPEDWLDCGQCRDCYLPAYDYRPGGSVQYALARRRRDGAGPPSGLHFGFVASSDNHRGRAGSGYKEVARDIMTDAFGPASPRAQAWLVGTDEVPPASPMSVTEGMARVTSFERRHDFERGASFFYTGGLVAVHARAHTREAIWEALEQRRTYATSGARILLWFDLVDGAGRFHPMGASVRRDGAPHFRVRAAGAPVQRPGCPAASVAALGPERLASLCRGECFHPTSDRHRITRIDVVRIRPQQTGDERIESLIDDPWRTFPCGADEPTCEVTFEDADPSTVDRETLYYVRAIQEPTPTINAGGLRCRRDARGACTAVRPCYAAPRTPATDDCLAPSEERAWSSPIYVVP